MNMDSAIRYIHSLSVFGSRPGLERVRALLERCGNPHRSLNAVHIAGTNGKGSTAAMLASILRARGLRAGLFTSPGVETFSERIQIGFEPIPPAALCALAAELKAHTERLSAEGVYVTEFEFVTALGFLHFARAGVEAAVVEVGMGGRFDATNVLERPLLSVITPVSLDHTKVLGDTVEAIAAEKAGILKEGVPVVVCPWQDGRAMGVIRETALRNGCALYQPDETDFRKRETRLDGSDFVYRGQPYTLPLPGAHQLQNALTAIEAALRLGAWDITPDEVRRGLASVAWTGRLEVVRERPLCLLDGAHNPAKIAALAAAIDDLLPGRRLVSVMGLSGDKDEACVTPIARRSAALIAFDGFEARGKPVPASRIAETARLHCKAIEASALEEAAELALREAGEDGAVLFCGSMYFLGDAKRLLRRKSNAV
ncbi:MAG: bifunctional folylpolyglutamate synthase/dihydrofolate synthase [Oscillospiraceae bacterium]|nr:bifunctional folylpolyglutamate synthase/dihydrofolate synthase [Oscillospiraceae bacterium]